MGGRGVRQLGSTYDKIWRGSDVLVHGSQQEKDRIIVDQFSSVTICKTVEDRP